MLNTEWIKTYKKHILLKVSIKKTKTGAKSLADLVSRLNAGVLMNQLRKRTFCFIIAYLVTFIAFGKSSAHMWFNLYLFSTLWVDNDGEKCSPVTRWTENSKWPQSETCLQQPDPPVSLLSTFYLNKSLKGTHLKKPRKYYSILYIQHLI